MWSLLNKSLVRNLKFANLSFIFNFSASMAKSNTNLRYFYCPRSTFGFSTYKKYNEKKYGKYENLAQLYKDYKMKHATLRIHDHLNYFLDAFHYKQKIDQKNIIWKLLNQNVLQHLKRYSYSQIIRIISFSLNKKINNILKREAQQIAFQKINQAEINSLQVLLKSLNIGIQSGFLQANSQTEEKYYKIYDQFEQIFKIKEQKYMQKSKVMKKEEKQNIFDINRIPIRFTSGKNVCSFQKNHVQISKELYFRLCIFMSNAKFKRRYLIQYLFNNPFLNLHAKYNLDQTSITQLKVILNNITKCLYQKKQFLNQKKKDPCLQVIIKQLIQRQKKIEINKYFMFTLQSLFKYASDNLKKISLDNDQVNKKQKMQFNVSFKEYLALYLKTLYQNRQTLKISTNRLVGFFVFGQSFGVHFQSLLKNIVSEAIKQTNNPKNQNIQEMGQLKNNIKYFQNIVWTKVWNKYQNFDIQTKETIAVYITKCQEMHIVKIKVPSNIKLIGVDMQQENSQIPSMSKENKHNQQIEKTDSDKVKKRKKKNNKIYSEEKNNPSNQI